MKTLKLSMLWSMWITVSRVIGMLMLRLRPMPQTSKPERLGTGMDLAMVIEQMQVREKPYLDDATLVTHPGHRPLVWDIQILQDKDYMGKPVYRLHAEAPVGDNKVIINSDGRDPKTLAQARDMAENLSRVIGGAIINMQWVVRLVRDGQSRLVDMDGCWRQHATKFVPGTGTMPLRALDSE